MTAWEKFFDEKIRLIASRSQTILDVGGGLKFSKGMAAYQKLFANHDYKTLDIAAEYKPDILGDIHNLPLPQKSLDAVICKAVLEHVVRPETAVSEIYRVLKPGGMGLLYVPFLYPYHAHSNYQDYYRFSRDGIRYLFKDFAKIEIVPVRGFWETWFYFLPFGLNRMFGPSIGRLLDKLKKQSGNQASGYNIFVIK